MSDFDKWFEPRRKKIIKTLDDLEPYIKEYFHKDENGNTIIDIEKIKRDKDKIDFTAGTTPIMFKKEDKRN